MTPLDVRANGGPGSVRLSVLPLFVSTQLADARAAVPPGVQTVEAVVPGAHATVVPP